MTTAARQPIVNDDMHDIITHVNEGHVPELLHCVKAYTPVQDATHVQMTAVYEDGMELEVTAPAGLSRHFVAYAVPGPAHEAIRGTVSEAMKKLGVKPDSRVAHWRLTENRALTAHFRRLTVNLGEDERADWRPGYACRFDVPGHEHGRPYTLRRVSGTTAEVDVYCHDNTLGSQWAEGLQPGETVTARGDYQEVTPDFSAGPALLLGDETALPTIAALLEGWADEHPVRVLLEVGDAADQRYLDDVHLPSGAHVSWLPRMGGSGTALREVLDALETPPAAVWGAMEVSAAKALRKHLRTEYPDADVRVTGYWRVNEKN
ncbi:SIP domain-containing protein [Deinococcus sp. HMF7604]|uniref:siderophore-interacting protein n=1 Tax=Deinococcus betulae TaxID=2873312 RepID=UPI001CC9CDB7|nr:siderophore-interacting protein [Deinococcus betulae]MBZ9753052.1 SIP domain-containing protein [Deinococcus betulae]